MERFSLTIIEINGDRNFRVELHAAQSEILFCKNPVHNDRSYEMALNFPADDAAIFINGYRRQCTIIDGRIIFADDKIFYDCFGYVEIAVVDGAATNLHSEYIPVLVKNNDALNRHVTAMARFVYDSYENFFITGEHKTLMSAGFVKNRRKSLIARLTLAKEIVGVYENLFGYFKANCKFKLDKVAAVDRLNRAQYISATTLQYIAAHPEHLEQVSGHGVRVGKNFFQPTKALTLRNVYSNDIYENQTLLWFLKKIIGDLAEMSEQCKNFTTTAQSEFNGDYDYSATYIFAPLNIDAICRQLQSLQKKCAELFTRYEDAMQIRLSKFFKFNGATAIFKTVPQYNKIFVAIYQWQNFGVYDFAGENFMIRLLTISLMYERYLLAKMLAYFTAKNYQRQDCESVRYSLYSTAKYKIDDFPNKFQFQRGDKTVTIYYQPIVSDGRTEPHLYRNNTIAVEDEYRGANYYVPDFVVKVDNGGRVKYLIIDAKFSSHDVLRKFRVRELAFKYLFSLSALYPNEKICGICVMYGKCAEFEAMRSVYDKRRGDIHPLFEMLPLMENANEAEHFANLDKLFLSMENDDE